MNKSPIHGNGYRNVEIDLGTLNCMKEPYVIDMGEGVKFILRFKQTAKDDDYGKIFLERLAK